MIEATEVADDRRQCCRHDRAVECGEQHHQHEAGEDDVHLPLTLLLIRVRHGASYRSRVRHVSH